jgi:hypothetical protein
MERCANGRAPRCGGIDPVGRENRDGGRDRLKREAGASKELK